MGCQSSSPEGPAKDDSFIKNSRGSSDASTRTNTSFVSTTGSSGEWARKKVRSNSTRLSDTVSLSRSPKSAADRKTIASAVQDCTLLGALKGAQLNEMIDYMQAISLRSAERPARPAQLCAQTSTQAHPRASRSGERHNLTDCMCIILEGELQVVAGQCPSRHRPAPLSRPARRAG